MICKECSMQDGNDHGFKCDFCGATNHADGTVTQGDAMARQMYRRNLERQQEIDTGSPRRRSREADDSPRWNRY